MLLPDEKELQKGFAWSRSGVYANYNQILGYTTKHKHA